MDHKVKLHDGQEKLSLLIEKEENKSLEALRLSLWNSKAQEHLSA